MKISKVYDPKQVEDKWYRIWLEKNYFAAKPNKSKKPFVIVIPPPNVTSILHMGHALNNTIQDIFIRFRRKQGYETLWQPGTDHAGIATQNVVEKNLAEQNISSSCWLTVTLVTGRLSNQYPPKYSSGNRWDTPDKEGALKSIGYREDYRHGEG